MKTREQQYDEVVRIAMKANPASRKYGNQEALKALIQSGISLDVTKEVTLAVQEWKPLGHGNSSYAAGKKNITLTCTPVLQLAVEGQYFAVNSLLKQGASKDDALYGYALAKIDHGQIEKLLKKGAKKEAAMKGYLDCGLQYHAYKLQYQEQLSKRNWRTFWVVLAAILFLPSLFISIPLWIRAKKNEPLQEITVLDSQYKAVKEKKKLVLKEVEPKVKDTEKSRKVIAWQRSGIGPKELDSKGYLMDQGQLKRFSIFANHDEAYLLAHQSEIEEQVKKSKEESKAFLAEMKSRGYKR